MKKLLIILLVLFSFQLTKAQGNLQFNAVKNIELYGSRGIIGSITVPSGKVWKIESVSFSSGDEYQTYGVSGNKYNLFIDKHIVYSNLNSASVSSVNLPVWFPEGTYAVFADTYSNSGYAKISALEFNIISN